MVTVVRWGVVLSVAMIAGLSPQTIPHAHANANAATVIRADQWQLKTLRAERAWQISRGAGVTVAVLDSGVAANHADLTGQVLPGIDLVDRGLGDKDPVGHGTTVASLIAGRSDDAEGVVGLAPDAKILPVRVLDAQNKYDDAVVVAEGVRWAVDHGAQVINMSLGGGTASVALAEAIDYAFARNVVVVACVGNVNADVTPQIWYPAREPGILAVTAIMPGAAQQVWGGAVNGPQTVLAAPGTSLTGAKPGGYWQIEGTSFAAPFVAATAALVRSRWPEMSAANVVERLITTADDLGTPGRDERYGFGLVDPVKALTADVPFVSSNPLDHSPPPGRSGFGHAPLPSGATPSNLSGPLGQSLPGAIVLMGGSAWTMFRRLVRR